MVDIRNFYSNLLRINKKSYKEIDVYNIGCIMIKRFRDCENMHCVNLLYLIIHSATRYFEEKNGEKYLILDSTGKYEEVWSGIRSEIKTFNGGKELLHEKFMLELDDDDEHDTDGDLPLNKTLKCLTLRIIIRCVLQKDEKLYP